MAIESVSMLMGRVMRLISVTALLGSASAAVAQPAPSVKEATSTTVAPLTVTAAPTPKTIQQQSRSFVQSYAAAPNPEVDQIGRWHDAVCVQVEGLAPEAAAVIKARIESVAKAVGLPAARPGCTANVEIVFSDKPQGVMDGVAKRRESLLGYHQRLDTNRVKTVTHPIQAWYQTATRGEGPNAGLAFAILSNSFNPDRPPNVGYPGATTEGEAVDDPRNTTPTGCADSHFSSCLKSGFRNVFMVADSKTLEGKDLGLVADDMAMLALSQPRSLDGCNILPSVIDVFGKSACSARDPPDGLTPADAAYLTALYSADLEAKKTSEQGDIARRMAKMLAANEASTR
jgi:hypothetical protein